MQLKVLLKKDLTSLFQQKAIIATLFIPLLFMASFGLLPTLLGVTGPFEVYYLNEDQGISDMNLGEIIIANMTGEFEQSENIELIEIPNTDDDDKDLADFLNKENGFWLPSNFTYQANLTHNALYHLKMSDTNLRADLIMNGRVAIIIETTVNEKLLAPITPPIVTVDRVYADSDIIGTTERERRENIAFPLAYMAFLILILAGSSMRITGFYAEKQAGMMELLMSSVVYRRELILSKLITGVIYGLASVLSYMVGIIVVILFENEEATEGTEFASLVFPEEAMTFINVLLITVLFSVLTFLSMQIILASQLVLGKEAGDRVGSMVNMILAFIFYFGTLGDARSETPMQMTNPFYWPFRVCLNLIYRDSYFRTLIYTGGISAFSLFLLLVKTKAVERERTIFD
ncbi:MAG: ABC transporter permease [Candidatus Kariarchaeaceae archaeon]